MAKTLYTIIVTVLLALSFPAALSANTVQAVPDEVFAGDVFLLKVELENPDQLRADFRGKTITLSPVSEGRFLALVPVDAGTPPGNYSVSLSDRNRTIQTALRVKPKKFRTIHLTLPEGKVTLSPENRKRVEREYLLQKKIWDSETAKTWDGPFTEPTGTEISTEFGVKRIMNKKKTSLHRGMDFRGKKGTPVKAINAGTVVLASDLFYGGNTLIIDHGMGLYSVYMHLSAFKTEEGSPVVSGQLIGLVGSSGRATGPHLHISVKLNGVSVNPESLFNLKL